MAAGAPVPSQTSLARKLALLSARFRLEDPRIGTSTAALEAELMERERRDPSPAIMP